MDYCDEDVIVAPATSPQMKTALAIVRVSGSGCFEYLTHCFRSLSGKKPRSWKMVYGEWLDDRGIIDDVMLVCYAAPRSYTGQDMIEITCHGNPLFVEDVIRSLLVMGARRARPGEFTMRAVLAGKMDLLQAEAVHTLVEANTRYQADVVRRQSKGPLVPFVGGRVEDVLQIQAHIEATIDYGEEDIDALERDHLLFKMDTLLADFEGLRLTGGFAKGMRRGFKVLLTGAPNVGKSTLFNRLVQEERAIVTSLPGTTRDLISEEIEIRGLPVVLIDSAGVRETDDYVENLGMEKIFKKLEDVDLVLYLSESGSSQPAFDALLALPQEKWLRVVTKIDLVDEDKGDIGEIIGVSAQSGAGLERLEEEVVVRLSSAMEGQSVYLINQRQEEVIAQVIEQLRAARNEFAAGFGEEILSAYLNHVRRLLGELTGETTTEDVLDRMFSNFCLGK